MLSKIESNLEFYQKKPRKMLKTWGCILADGRSLNPPCFRITATLFMNSPEGQTETCRDACAHLLSDYLGIWYDVSVCHCMSKMGSKHWLPSRFPTPQLKEVAPVAHLFELGVSQLAPNLRPFRVLGIHIQIPWISGGCKLWPSTTGTIHTFILIRIKLYWLILMRSNTVNPIIHYPQYILP